MTRLTIAAVLVSQMLAALATAQPAQPARIGQIHIVGNDITMDSVIRKELGFYPGQVLCYPELKKAEERLIKRNLFKVDPKTKTGPTITALDDRNGTKDVLVQIKETSTSCYRVELRLDRFGPALSVVFEERNFDVFRVPSNWADIYNGAAFRGAGEKLHVELLRARIPRGGVEVFPRSQSLPILTILVSGR